MITGDESLDVLIRSDAWPEAVSPSMIVDTPHDQQIRARSIIKNMLPDLSGKTFLDFGCGSGVVATIAKEKARISHGYDIIKTWNDEDHLKTELVPAPYDVILLYDVVDHAEDSVMDVVRTLCHKDTIVLVRTHPFMSIHGAHQYYKYNKAYVHYFLPFRTIHEEFGPVRGYNDFDPRKRYTKSFDGFTVEKVEEHRIAVPEFFTTGEIFERIRKRFTFVNASDFSVTNIDDNSIIDVMGIQFIDYTLKIIS